MSAGYLKSKVRPRMGQRQTINYQLSAVNDPLARAIERERGFWRAYMPECESVVHHVFTCVCCGKIRGDQERREPRSEVCVRCEQDAGFFN